MRADIGLSPEPGREYKLFLVEVDDDDRERVLAGRVDRCEIDVDHEYSDVHTDFSDYPMARYMTSQKVTVTLNMVPSEDGTYFRIENFADDDDSNEFAEEDDEDA